jgi:steroid delta-isomerase-like uncharacterized protein
MKTQELLDVARGSVEAFNERDWNRFREILAPNAVYDEVGTGRKSIGRDEIVSTIRGWTEAFSNVKATINSTLALDDRVLIEVTYKGTQDGELAGPTGSIPPTDRPITTRCAQVCRVSEGRIVEMRNYFDMLSMLQALNALPAQAARRAGA